MLLGGRALDMPQAARLSQMHTARVATLDYMLFL